MRAKIDHGQFANTSGADWPGAEMRPRGRELAPQPEAGPLPHRRPVLVDGGNGCYVAGDFTPGQVRHLAFCRAVDESPPAAQPYLDHVLATGYTPGR